MKILYLVHQFYPEYYTGTEKFVFNMASMMQKFGCKVKVVTYSFYDNSFYDRKRENILIREFLYKGIPVLAFKYTIPPPDLHYGLLRDDNLIRVATEILLKEKPDILHVGHPMRVSEFIRACIDLKIPYIITITDYWLLCPKVILYTSREILCFGPEGGNACRALCPELPSDMIVNRLSLSKFILANAKFAISPSLFLSSIFRKEFRDLEIKVINHGIPYSTIKKNRKSYKKGDKLTFFYGGSLNLHKGIHVLIEAFKKISSNNVSLKIYGSGNEEYTHYIRMLVKDDRRIELCGVFHQDEVGEILSNIDITIVPSIWYENYPLILHESLACNVPVVASNIGGMAERIEDGVNGLLFNVGDSNHLKEILHQLIDNPEQINTLKSNIEKQMIPTVEQEAFSYYRLYKLAISDYMYLR